MIRIGGLLSGLSVAGVVNEIVIYRGSPFSITKLTADRRLHRGPAITSGMIFLASRGRNHWDSAGVVVSANRTRIVSEPVRHVINYCHPLTARREANMSITTPLGRVKKSRQPLPYGLGSVTHSATTHACYRTVTVTERVPQGIIY